MAIYDLLDKNKYLNAEERQQRNAICKNCEHSILGQKTCSVCGCVIWLKSRLKTEDCPKGKWPALN
ncbi:MAG: DUF6171 family protein [Bacteroidota bacterium]